MTKLVIGSAAARTWFPDWREPKDYDVFTDEQVQPTTGLRIEPFWHPRLSDWLDPATDRIATPAELLTIKHSHVYWELPRTGSWGKHMHDILELKKRGAELIPWLHDLLYGVWEDIHGRKKVNLTEESDEFFADAVKRKYDHDSLHRSVAYSPGKPIYEEVLRDGKSVQMDMKKVWAMPHGRIVQLFREEVLVTALERKIVPSNYTHSPGAAYQWALRRTITSLTKGASAKFMVENFDAFRKPDMDYVARHLENKDQLIELEAV